VETSKEEILKVLTINALRKLQKGSILQAISHTLAIIGLTLLTLTVRAALNKLNTTELILKSIDFEVFEKYIIYSSIVFIGLLITLFALILLVASMWGFIIPGARYLANIDARFTKASNLLNLGWIWGTVIAIIGLVMSIASAYLIIILPICLGLLIVGIILILLGYTGLIILTIKLSDFEKIERYETTAILFTLSSFIPLLIPIPWILFYLALKTSELKHLGLSS